jgi:SAM-dependent methyltransferase
MPNLLSTLSLALPRHLHRYGVRRILAAGFDRLFPARARLAPQALKAAQGREGLEIGGPSRIFSDRGALPLYRDLERLDNVNFAANTAWERNLTDGGSFAFHPEKPAGRQFLLEATNLRLLRDGSYDFVISSHCLEHLANPLKALREWRRIVRPGGYLILVLPQHSRTFDHARPVTTLAHLRDDFARATPEDDQTHLEEILALHDLRQDPHAGTAAQFRARALRNFENRCLHHHVFDAALIQAALEDAGWTGCDVETVRPCHLIALARKSP